MNLIWTYWDTSHIPEFIQKCIQTWKKTNAKIIIVTNETLHKYIDIDPNLTPQKKSDFLRLEVLSKYGGLWLDASIVCFSTFDWVFSQDKCTVFSIPEFGTETPLIESWFIYCKKGDQFVKKWKNEFIKIHTYENIEDYIKENNVNMNGIEHPDYLAIYVAARSVYKPGIISICNASLGPYKYHAQGGLEYLKTDTCFVKFRSVDRNKMTEEIEKYIFKEVN